MQIESNHQVPQLNQLSLGVLDMDDLLVTCTSQKFILTSPLKSSSLTVLL